MVPTDFLNRKDIELSHLLRLISDHLGIIPCQLNPMDLLQGWLTVQTDQSSSQCLGIANALRSVLREDPRALYKGLHCNVKVV
ncbi:Mitochondrial carrier domain-containing protein [Artemisia annua]|uniref:Mitochondrial carrier domain-containing protein n=1 Tax=Artemisia annua TaxID=35608 RepID=A0A2U1PKL5_ARTAN|nr:Mitochondrial carrier domain-containing protein [Artemisia annua]